MNKQKFSNVDLQVAKLDQINSKKNSCINCSKKL